jgi:hypothetical protein
MRFLGQKREKKIRLGINVIGSWTSVFGLGEDNKKSKSERKGREGKNAKDAQG